MAAPNNFLLEPVPHEEAARWISGKPVIAREVFDELIPELKARAFVIAGVEDANVAAEIRELVAELPRGADWQAQKKEIAAKLSTWFTPEAALARSEMLLRTHGFQAYQAAHHQVMERQAGVFPFWQYLSMDDEKVRPAHARLNEKVAAADDAFWHDHSPPWQWGCRCRKVALLEDEVDELRAEDARKPPEDRRVLEGTALKKAREGQLPGPNGQQVDIRSDRMRGKPDGYHFDPSTLRLSPDQLKARYDEETWGEFEGRAKRQPLGDGRTVWDWMNAKRPSNGGADSTGALPNVKSSLVAPARRNPVSKAITFPGDPTEAQVVSNVLAAIDTVHDDGRLPKTRVEFNPISVNVVSGWYDGDHDLISIASDILTPHLTSIHEVGHLLDYKALGLPNRATTSNMKHAPTEVQDWWDAVQKSRRYDELADPSVVTNPDLIGYYRDPPECFARTYMQFIARESGDSILRSELEALRLSPDYFEVWDDDDFAPIADQFKKVISLIHGSPL